jgi:cell division protein FtsL
MISFFMVESHRRSSFLQCFHAVQEEVQTKDTSISKQNNEKKNLQSRVCRYNSFSSH